MDQMFVVPLHETQILKPEAPRWLDCIILFGDGASKEAIQVKWSPKGEALTGLVSLQEETPQSSHSLTPVFIHKFLLEQRHAYPMCTAYGSFPTTMIDSSNCSRD